MLVEMLQNYLEIEGHDPGNSMALLNFRICSGDKLLQKIFKNCLIILLIDSKSFIIS